MNRRSENRLDATVLKFGSSVLRDEADLTAVVAEIYRHVRRARRVVAVVSALGGETDRLVAVADRIGDARLDHDLRARLLATGEARSAALLGLALIDAGLSAAVVEAGEIGLATRGSRLDSTPVDVDIDAVEKLLESRSVVVVPGFVGIAQDGSPALLGRGGSDLTALFIAERLGARCRLVKDVDGLYDRDPARHADARRYLAVDFDTAEALGGGIVQKKAIAFARNSRITFEVGSIGGHVPTRVGATACRWAETARVSAPLTVGVCGLGTVGLGVVRRLLAARSGSFSFAPSTATLDAAQTRLPPESPPDKHPFRLTSLFVRDVEKHTRTLTDDLPTNHGDIDGNDDCDTSLLTSDPETLFATEPDVVVELIGGEEPARTLITTALQRGADVVTANKHVMARHGPELLEIARRHGRRLLFSGAAGGAVPMLESVREIGRTKQIQRLTGILNGTCNFILGRLERGSTFDAALTEAQELGFAEADPSADIDGIDALEKIVLLAREAFHAADIRAGQRRGIRDVQLPREDGLRCRLVARASRTTEGVEIVVGPVTIASGHPLAAAENEENRLLVETTDGARHLFCGRGAGRGPTTESVIGDLGDILRARTREQDHDDRDAASEPRGVAKSAPTLKPRLKSDLESKNQNREDREPFTTIGATS